MSVIINISKTYRKPIQTYSRLFELGASEKQNLAFLIGGCVISFVSQWPVQARHAFANQQSIDKTKNRTVRRVVKTIKRLII